MRLFNHGTADNSAVLKHILKIDKVTVVHMLSIIVAVVEMDYTVTVRLDNLIRQLSTLGIIPADLACHIVTLNAVDGGVFIGIFLLCFLVIALNKRQYLVVGGVGGTHYVSGVTVANIPLGGFVSSVLHELSLNQFLNFLNRQGSADTRAVIFNNGGNSMNLFGNKLRLSLGCKISLGNGVFNFNRFKNCFGAVSFNNFHNNCLLWKLCKSIIANRLRCVNSIFAHFVTNIFDKHNILCFGKH